MVIGDVVYLNSNPKVAMTVSYVLGAYPANQAERDLDAAMRAQGLQDRDVACAWLDGTRLVTGYFRERMVTKK